MNLTIISDIYIWQLHLTFITDIYIWQLHLAFISDIYLWRLYLTFLFDIYIWHFYLAFIWHLSLTFTSDISSWHLCLACGSMHFPRLFSKQSWKMHWIHISRLFSEQSWKMYWIAKLFVLPLHFVFITKNNTLVQKTRTKLAATDQYWRLSSTPIVKKYVVSLCKFKSVFMYTWIAKPFILPLQFFLNTKNVTFLKKNSNETRRIRGILAAPEFANSGK